MNYNGTTQDYIRLEEHYRAARQIVLGAIDAKPATDEEDARVTEFAIALHEAATSVKLLYVNQQVANVAFWRGLITGVILSAIAVLPVLANL